MKVSVILATYNRADILDKAIQNVLDQSYPTLELIIVDDASTDSTERVVRSFDDKRIKYLKLPENIYYSHARNKGLELATGILIAFHDDDVLWDKDFLRELVIPHLQKDVVVTYCSRNVYNGVNLRELDLQTLPTLKAEQSPPFVHFKGNTDNMNGIVDVNEIVIKRDVFKGDFKGFREEKDNMYYCSDIALLDAIIRHNRQGRFVLVPKRLVHYFLNHGSRESMTVTKQKFHKEYSKFHPELEQDWLF